MDSQAAHGRLATLEQVGHQIAFGVEEVKMAPAEAEPANPSVEPGSRVLHPIGVAPKLDNPHPPNRMGVEVGELLIGIENQNPIAIQGDLVDSPESSGSLLALVCRGVDELPCGGGEDSGVVHRVVVVSGVVRIFSVHKDVSVGEPKHGVCGCHRPGQTWLSVIYIPQDVNHCNPFSTK